MFGRKKNKKIERQQKLGTKTNSASARASGGRMALMALSISTGVVLALLVFWKGGEFVLEEYVYKNPTFAIDRIDIQTDGVLPIDQIRKWAAVQIGDNLLRLELGRIKRDIELAPLVKSASVERQLPRRLILKVKEREPIAQVFVFQKTGDEQIQSTVCYLDEEGYVMPPATAHLNLRKAANAPDYFPTITGIQVAELRPGKPVRSSQALAALKLIREFQKSRMLGRVEIKSIDISEQNTLLVATEQGSEVIFSNFNFQPQLSRWRAVHDYGVKIDRVISRLDLAVANFLPVTWIGDPPVEQPTKPSSRKKNV